MALLSELSDSILGNRWLAASLFLLLGLGLIAAHTFYSWHRLRHIKGPFLASISKLWLARAVSGGKMHLEFAAACQKYGSLARIGPNDLVTSDPDVMRRMLAVRSPYRRADWYVGMRFDPSRENVESERNDEKHTALRGKMSAGYSGKEVENLERFVDEEVASLIKLVDKYATTGSNYKPLDFGRKAQYFTLDVISHIAYGKAFGYLTTDSDVYDYIKEVEGTLPAAMMVTVFPWINWILQMRIVKSFLPSEKDPIGFGKVIAITKEMVRERFGPNKKEAADMLGSFVRHGLTQEEAESETVLQIIAGSDTTAVAIRAIFLYLVTNPRVLVKLRIECSSWPISSPIQDAEARRLPYLQAIIKEGLRIWPPVVGLMAKEVPPVGDTINGIFIPGGTSIGYCAFGIFRDKKIFGDDANVFRPERWLEGEAARIKEQEQTLELIFAYGKYKCLGKDIALMELNKIFVELFRHFDFAVVDPQKPIGNNFCMGVFAIHNFWVTVSRREEIWDGYPNSVSSDSL